MEKKNKPRFNVLNFGFMKSVKGRWRKPRGTHNKKRMKFQWTGAAPNIGYKNPEAIRNLHPNGKPEVRVHNVADLEGLKDVLVRIAAQVGARKRKLIEEKADSVKLKVLNRRGKEKKEEKKAKPKKTKPKKEKKAKKKK